jgi:hypothetical protein
LKIIIISHKILNKKYKPTENVGIIFAIFIEEGDLVLSTDFGVDIRLIFD